MMFDSDVLEHRLVELLSTFHDTTACDHVPDEMLDCEAHAHLSQSEQQRLNILARTYSRAARGLLLANNFDVENLAFLICNNEKMYGNSFGAGDVFITMLGWEGYTQGLANCTLAVLVRATKTSTAKILQVRVEPKEKVLEKLGREVDKMLLKALLLA
jgi:hypothetical protein